MIICPRCGVEHEIGEEFCRKCGSFLLTDEECFLKVEKIETQLICPMCQDLHQKGNYCKRCGSLLRQETPSRETTLQPLEKKLIKKRSKEWLRLLKEKKELEICLKKLETQKDKISSDVFIPLSVRYQDRLKELLPLHQEIGAELDSVRRRASEEIGLIEEELKPIQKRLEEFQFLSKQAGITEADFLKEKHEIKRRIQSRARNLGKWRQFLSFLPREIGKGVVPLGFKEFLFRPLTLLVVSGFIILLGTGGYFLHQWYSEPIEVIPKEIIPSLATPLSSPSPRTDVEDQEVIKIKSLLDTVKQANLQKNIYLFMTCFSHDFTEKEKKRLDTLKTWDHFNYLNLSYDLKQKIISGDIADVRLEWLVRVSKKVGGKSEESRIILDATLKKENGHWKIQEIRPIS
jgi:hypothetical protein